MNRLTSKPLATHLMVNGMDPMLVADVVQVYHYTASNDFFQCHW